MNLTLDTVAPVQVLSVTDLTEAVANYNRAQTRATRKGQTDEILYGLHTLNNRQLALHADDIVLDLGRLPFEVAAAILEQLVLKCTATKAKLTDPTAIAAEDVALRAWETIFRNVSSAAATRLFG